MNYTFNQNQMCKIELMGVEYDPILTPQERIATYLSNIESLADNNPDLEHALILAKIWFYPEVEAIKFSHEQALKYKG